MYAMQLVAEKILNAGYLVRCVCLLHTILKVFSLYKNTFCVVFRNIYAVHLTLQYLHINLCNTGHMPQFTKEFILIWSFVWTLFIDQIRGLHPNIMTLAKHSMSIFRGWIFTSLVLWRQIHNRELIRYILNGQELYFISEML